MKFAFLAAIIVVLSGSCNDLKEPIFETVENLKLGKMSLAETNLSADLRFNNSNSFAFKLKSIDCDLYIDSNYLGHFNNILAVNVPAEGAFILPVTGKAQTVALMRQSVKTFTGERSLIHLVGKARIGKSIFSRTIPINFTDSMKLKF